MDHFLEGLKKADPAEGARQARARGEAEYAPQFQADLERDKARSRLLADYSPDWMSKSLIVTGTVSRVDLQPMPIGRDAWVVVRFQERPNGDFVVCFPRSLFDGAGGKFTTGLVGKTVDVRGSVTNPVCSPRAAGMQLGAPSQITVH